MERCLDNYDIKICDGDEYVPIPDDLINFMKQFPIYLDHDFNYTDNTKSKFLRLCCDKMCNEYWSELVKLHNKKNNNN